MKKSSLLKALLALSLLWSVFIINGCKKEATIKPTTTPIAVIAETIDSANFLKGLLGDEPVKFEGNAVYYKGYVDPDSAGHHDDPGNTGDPNGSTHDHDSYYQSGSKWVTINQAGLQLSTASVELRSLAVRVFVSPISASSNNYFNLLSQATYAVATSDNPSKGAYVTIRDKNGVLWTTAGPQDSSTFTITSRGSNMNTYTVVTGTISAKMYDGLGNMKLLTGATFTAALGI